ncbi:hypothetical protein EEL53_10050 [Muribaculaceae bacterium Isolate-114 (HZI)]|nr:hypothetical protein EEL53_10050 [Muribaculaceae bacterium Isolate-114 (HZI)]
MSVINLIPHSLSYLIATDGYEDDNGDWHEGRSGWSEPMKCHAVPAGRANEITFADGSTSYYSYTVGRLSPDCREFHIGEDVLLNVDGIERRFQVKGFHRYQLQSKIWV